MMPSLELLNEATLRTIAEDSVIYCNQKNGEIRKITIPSQVINQIIYDHGLAVLPTIRGIVANQYIDDQGQRITEPGIHNELLGDFESRHFERKEPLEALKFISDAVLSEFRFDGEKDGPDLNNVNRLSAIAAIVTAVQRKMLETAPMILIQAPEFKAGKSVLTDVITTIAAGRPVPKTYIPLSSTRNDHPEAGKRFETALISNPPAIAIDNLQDGGTLQSTMLTALLTQSQYEFRELGKHSSCTVQTNVLFVANGRNNGISDQLASRILVIKLAEGKSSYKRNAVQDAIEKRDEIISACLDITEVWSFTIKPSS